MDRKKTTAFLVSFIWILASAYSQQRGEIIFAGDGTMDPDGDGYVSTSPTGFSIDGYYVDEFELKMFGVPIAGNGDVIGDAQVGCSVTDLAADTAGYSVYGVLDGPNLIFRFRISDDRNSVEAYTILIDTDNKIGPEDPNSTPDNPGFELDITLVKNASKGVYIYNIDGIESCPSPEFSYPFSTHFQKSVAGTTSCGDNDYFYDFYIPFEILNTLYGVTAQSEIRIVAVTNVSATCAMGGKISDVGGVDDSDPSYASFADMFLALSSEQCPTALEDLCQTCEGFKVGTTEKPTINQPIKVGETAISGTSEGLATVFLSVFDEFGGEVETLESTADFNGNWDFELTNPLTNEDSITARAQIEGACSSGLSESDVSYAVVVINTPPVISGSTGILSYTENGDPVPIFDDLTISDVDDTEMDSAWLTVTANYDAGEDEINLPPGQGLTIEWESSLMRVRIYGKASLATYESVIQGITYSNSSDDPDDANTRTFTIQTHDGLDASNVLSRNLLPVKVNDAPVISGSTSTIGYEETDFEEIIDNTITITDVDNTTMSGATVSIVQEYDDAEDTLIFVNQNGISGSFDDVNGILSLTGTATLAQYETALRSVTYQNLLAGEDPVNPIANNATRVVRFQASDGVDNSNTTQRPIDMLTVPNQAPVFVDDFGAQVPDTISMTIDEDMVLDTCLYVTDPDDDVVSISLYQLENDAGSVSIISELCFTFTPDADYNGLEYISIIVTDAPFDPLDQLTDTLVIKLTINPVNDDPVIVDGSNNPIDTVEYVANEDTPSNFCIDAIDIELDPVVLEEVVSLSGNSTSNIPTPSNLCFDYTPDVNFFGNDTLRMVVCEDGSTTRCDTIIAIVDVIPQNDPPVIQNAPTDTIFFDALEDIITKMCVTANDPDMDNTEVLDAIHLEGPGIFEPNPLGDLCFFFQSMRDSTGMVYAKIVVCDDASPALCDTIIAAVMIEPVNDEPVILDENDDPLTEFDSLFFTINEDETIDVCISATDVDNDDLEISSITNIQGGGIYDIYDAANLCFTYTPDPDFNGTAIGEVTICESANDTVCVSTVIVFDIIPVNDPPIIEDDVSANDTVFFETDEDMPLNLCLVVNDPDGDPIVISDVTSDDPNGTFDPGDVSDLCVLYTPDEDFNGEVVGEVIICDNQDPALCDTVIVVIDVNPVNDPPEVLDENGLPVIDSDSIFVQIMEDGTLDLCLDAEDPDNDPLFLSAIEEVNINGLITISDADALCINYTPSPNFNGRDIAKLTVCENQPDSLCTNTVLVIDVEPVNDKPIIVDGSNNPIDTVIFNVNEDESTQLCISVEDVDDNILTISNVLTNNTNAFFDTSLGDNLCMLFSSTPDYFGQITSQVVISDNQSPALTDTVVMIVNVLPVDDPPDLLIDGESGDLIILMTDEDVPLEFCIEVEDPDSENLSDLSTNSLTGLGSYDEDAGCFVFTPNENISGAEQLTVSICDETSLCDQVEIRIIINPVNDSPVAEDDHYESDIYTSFAGNILNNDSDIENQTLTAGIIDISDLHGTLDLSENGSFVYKPSRGFVGEETFTYIVCDNGEGPACATGTVTFVLDDPLIIWEAVSPNGDGMNDYWVIEGIDIFPNNQVKIFDRYNNLVYEVSGYNNMDVVWNGQSNRGLFTSDVPEGTYFYLLDLGEEKGGGPPLNGFIILKND